MTPSGTKRVVYPGSFDPITHGHQDIIVRAAGLFDEVVVAVAINPAKGKGLFSPEEREDLIRKVVGDVPNVTVKSFRGLLVDFVLENDCNTVVRGLRAVSDFENEFQMALVNKRMVDSVETVFLASTNEFSYLSSTVIKEVASFGGDISAFVHPVVEKGLKEKFANARKSGKL